MTHGLVTGGAGFVGFFLADRLAWAEDQAAVDRFAQAARERSAKDLVK
jgi:nucleoside-diphosphate-sugar epimerase